MRSPLAGIFINHYLDGNFCFVLHIGILSACCCTERAKKNASAHKIYQQVALWRVSILLHLACIALVSLPRWEIILTLSFNPFRALQKYDTVFVIYLPRINNLIELTMSMCIVLLWSTNPFEKWNYVEGIGPLLYDMLYPMIIVSWWIRINVR